MSGQRTEADENKMINDNTNNLSKQATKHQPVKTVREMT